MSVNNGMVYMGMHNLFELVLFHFDKYTEVELLDYIVVLLFFFFLRNLHIVSIAAAPIYVPSKSA